MAPHTLVKHDAWLEARKKHLAKEKEFTRMRDQLSRERRDLPWELVEKNYVFDGPDGKVTLADLFDGRSQLVVKHEGTGSGLDGEEARGHSASASFSDWSTRLNRHTKAT